MLARTITALLVCLAGPVLGAEQLVVTVHDPSGALVPGASVVVTPRTGGPIAAATDDQGVAKFSAVTTGEVRVHVEAAGFVPQDQSANVKRGDNRVQAQLKIAEHKEEVSVELDKREEMTDRHGPAFGTTLTPAQIEALPDDPDEMKQVLEAMAGPGATMRVDGFFGGRLPHKSQIASIRFRISPYTVEDHDLGFNIVEITTKPGFAGWHGSGAFGYGGDTFNARNFFAPVREPEQMRRVDLSLSGPLRRNKTSLALSFDRNFSYDSKTTVGVGPEGPFSDLVKLPFESTTFQTRFQNAWHKTHVMRGEFQYHTQDRANIGNSALPERRFSNGQSLYVLRLADAGAVSEHALNEMQFQTQWITSTALSASAGTALIVPGAFSAGGAGLDSRRESRESEFRDDFTFNIRNHSLRAGVLAGLGYYRDRDLTNANGTFSFASLTDYQAGRPLLFTQRLGNAAVHYDQYQFGAYVQDDMRLSKSFSLTAGLRWEAQTHVRGRTHLAPRAGFAWSPFKNGKTTIRGGGGIYYQWFASDLLGQALRVNGSNQSDLVILNPGYPDALQLPPSVYRRDASLNLPYLIRSSFGVQRQWSFASLTMDARWERGEQLLWSHNVNAPAAGAGRPDVASGNIFNMESGANSWRKELVVSLHSAPRVGPSGLRMFWAASYVLSKSVDETGSPLLAPSDNFNLRADRGPSALDARHRVFALWNGTLGKGFQLATIFQANSGMPYNITTGFDNNGDTVINDRPVGVRRNSARGSGLWDSSARLSWTKGFGTPSESGATARVIALSGSAGVGDIPTLPGQKPSRYQLQFYSQIYNLFNHANLSNYVGVQTSPLFGQGTVAAAGRRVEFGIRLGF